MFFIEEHDATLQLFRRLSLGIIVTFVHTDHCTFLLRLALGVLSVLLLLVLFDSVFNFLFLYTYKGYLYVCYFP